jgi:aryl-alcohol dehydrogenase-like predicted oxidoreductase
MPFGRSRMLPWFLDEAEARAVIQSALEAGITFFDTADMYSLGESEQVTGKALAKLARRDEVVVATKVGMPTGASPTQRGLSRKHIMDALDASLERLGMDYVDLYIAHEWDDGTPIEETLAAFHDVIRSGKARYVGASGMKAWQFAKALFLADRHGWTRFVSMQSHYNLLQREDERELMPLCLDQRVGLTPFSPLARGLLAGSRARGGPGETTRARFDERARTLYRRDESLAVLARVQNVADGIGAQAVQVALAWVLAQPGISAPVVGARSPEQLAALVAAEELVLDAEQCRALVEPVRRSPVDPGGRG